AADEAMAAELQTCKVGIAALVEQATKESEATLRECGFLAPSVLLAPMNQVAPSIMEIEHVSQFICCCCYFMIDCFKSNSGVLFVDADGCIASTNFLNDYPGNDVCVTGNRRPFEVKAFSTVAGRDKLHVNG
ncbi:hypothetical protein AK812_SmicGene42590, partial [Symbiodinium microadriaticum]